MNQCIEPKPRPARRILSGTSAVIAMAFAVSAPLPAFADKLIVPEVPPNIQVLPPNHPYLIGRAVGTQNYVCAPAASSPGGVAYVLITPQATLFQPESDKLGAQLTSHFFSGNPSEPNTNPKLAAGGTIRATWRHSRDSSTVWAEAVKGDAAVVSKDAIAWVKLTARGVQEGPGGGDTLTKTTFIQRVNTVGGLAPSTGCASPGDLGNQAFVAYSADYVFYTDR